MRACLGKSRVQRFPEKALVLLDECFPSSDQFKLKESLNRLLSSDFSRLLELMPVFLSGIRYDFICLKDLSTSRNTIGPPVMSGKFNGGQINIVKS